jgi:c-di-AMP phosphodiesterase-like protein
LQSDDIPTCIAFLVVQFSTLEVDDNFTSYVLDRFQKAAELEKQWLKSLQNMPTGIMLYNMKEKTVTFENEMMRYIFKNSDQEV